MLKNFNLPKLSKELMKAGISLQGNCNSQGVVWDDDNNEIQDRADVVAVLKAHDPIDYSAVNQAARLILAKDAVKAIPSWAKWTEEESLSWVQANISTPLADARASLPATLTLATVRVAFFVLLGILYKMLVLMVALTRMSVALRNKNWPELPEE